MVKIGNKDIEKYVFYALKFVIMFLYYYQINKGLKAAADKIFFQKLLGRF